MSIATIGVVLMSALITPTGTMSLRSVWPAERTVRSRRHATRLTTPVWMTPLAMTSIAATVITPPLLRPPNRALGSTTPVTPAAASPVASASTGGTLPEAMATSVRTTMAAAQ